MGWRLVRLDQTQLLVPLLLFGQMQLIPGEQQAFERIELKLG